MTEKPSPKPTEIKKSTVDAFNPTKQAVLWDSRVKGFGLLALPSGTKSYIFQFRLGGRAGKLKRYTMGRHGALTPDQAYKRAQVLRAMVLSGIDPVEAERAERAKEAGEWAAKVEAERLLKELAFSAYVEDFISKALATGKRDRTKDLYAQALRSHAVPVLKQKALPQIRKADVNRVLDKIPAKQPAVRRNVFAVMRILLNWAVDRGDIEASPMATMKAPAAAESRERVLSDEELALALRAADTLGAPFGPFYRLIFLTGQRREECAATDWREFDRAASTWTLPADRTKNGEAHIVPLAPALVTVLDRLAGQEGAEEPKWPRRGYLFATDRGTGHVKGYSRAKARLDAAMLKLAKEDALAAGECADKVTLEPWRVHDARRTLATGFQRLGIRFEVTEAVLNHVSGASRSGVAAVYQRHTWAEEKRAALIAWAEFLDRLTAPPQAGNVVPFKQVSPGAA
jgi:integrase